MGPLEGKTALVTGSSRGIGRAIAIELAGKGCDVAMNFRQRETEAGEVVREIEEAGRRGIAIRADVGIHDEAVRLFESAVEFLGGLDILVNNAGVWRSSPIEEVDAEYLEWVIAVNLKSAFYLTSPAVAHMKERGWGRILNVSSVTGVTGYPLASVYSSTKAALIGMVKSLARELVRWNITVNALVPGFIDTDMTAYDGEEVKKVILKTIPMRRYGIPEDVARLAAFLCEHGDYITGQLFTVDGGVCI